MLFSNTGLKGKTLNGYLELTVGKSEIASLGLRFVNVENIR